MAKDDYYTIVCKILVFLYKKLKGKEKRSTIEYIAPLTKDFPIEESYMEYVIEQMVDQGFVDKVNIIRGWGGDIVRMDYEAMRITPAGIDHLRDNDKMRRVAETLIEAAPIASLFI